MNALSDNHMHSEYSRNGHALGTIREVVESARSKGLKEIIISDHGPGHVLFGVKREKLNEIREEIDKLNKEYSDINILMGCESNVISYSGKIDLSNSEIKILDRLSVGFHYGIIPNDLKTFFIFMIINPISKVFKPLRNYVKKESTDAIIRIVENYPIDIITHPGSKVELDINRLAKVCAERGTALEINSSHGHLTVEGIKEAMPSGVMFSLGSDSHKPENIGKLTNSINRATEAGLTVDRIINIME